MHCSDGHPVGTISKVWCFKNLRSLGRFQPPYGRGDGSLEISPFQSEFYEAVMLTFPLDGVFWISTPV
jgi:hypothetical protein